MDIELKYGSEKVTLHLPADARVERVEPRAFNPPPSEEVIRAALQHPIDSPRLEDIARGKERVVLIVSERESRRTG